MALYQPKLLKEQKQDEALIAKRWATFQDYKAKSQKIKAWKEEEYQDGFLRDVFENCLGYRLKTSSPANYNLEREKKNETDSKKADGVIYADDKVIGVIELKDQKTKNLDRVEQQAFWYLTQHSDAKYVIISNFDEIRFYVEKSTAYERFYLFEMGYEEFTHLHLLLSCESIEAGLPMRLKEKSVGFEQQISKDLYKDFSSFRLRLFENILKNNPKREPKELLRLTQKLCDRIIFILFAEDRGLLRSNTIKEIREEFKNQKFTEYALYDIYKFYFHAINKGDSKLDIPKYNGGLFASDEVLDSLAVDDEFLDMEAQKLSDYDFLSDVGVNILGHIFEQSLTDLEELTASIDKKEFDKTKTKRKKDGVFYTPEYITKYIVENTLGKLCEEKKKELAIPTEIEVKNPRKLLKKEQIIKETILSYREWLKELKILDPACGSGAFLNQALEYLIAEHTLVRDLLLPYSDLTIGYEIEKEILENNLYGVDINEDATEIAKLSLWLRTAYRGRELTKLADKIVCANSLLDMPFPEGSFDVVIGNPPYFNIQTLGAKSPIAQSIQKGYPEIWQDKSDIIFYFIAKSIELTKNKVGFIVSNAFLYSDKAKRLRNYILENIGVTKITNFEQYMVFEDASITTAIIEFDKQSLNQKTLAYSFKDKKYDSEILSNHINNEKNYFDVNLKKDTVFALVDSKINAVNEKIDSDFSKLIDLCKMGKGMETAADKVFLFKEFPTQFPKEFIKNRVTGKNTEKYFISDTQEYILYFEDIENFEELPQSIQSYLLENKEFLENRATVKNEGRIWWRYSRPMHKELYSHNKIFCSRRAFNNIFALDTTREYLAFSNMTIIFETNKNLDLKYILSLLNSKALNFRYKSIGKQTGGGSFEYFPNGVGKLPIPEIDKEKQQPFINLVDEILESKQKIKEYKTLLDEAIKNDNFDREIKLKKEIEKLENICISNEKTIDSMVYELYGLSDDEIKIVEGF